MERICIRFYATESQRHGGKLVYEWLLERAKALGVAGGTALRAIAGFGRHGVMHEQGFFELAGNVPVEVEFITDRAEAAALLESLNDAGVKLFYVSMPVEAGSTGSPD